MSTTTTSTTEDLTTTTTTTAGETTTTTTENTTSAAGLGATNAGNPASNPTVKPEDKKGEVVIDEGATADVIGGDGDVVSEDARRAEENMETAKQDALQNHAADRASQPDQRTNDN